MHGSGKNHPVPEKESQRPVIYDCIVVGGGAAGLFYAAGDATETTSCQPKLLLEKTARPGQKLLMSGNGQCNLTHGGSIKDFVSKYGDQGKRIRSCLYRHNNLELMSMMESMGVPLTEREDGKIFPASMKAWEVLDALLATAKSGGWDLRCNAEVTAIHAPANSNAPADLDAPIEVVLANGDRLHTRKLVLATGGASYPATGSDGTFYEILRRDLGLAINTIRPALTPVYVQDYHYQDLSGISFPDVTITCGGHTCRGALLLTHKCFSGPAILHISQYVKAGDPMVINYLPSFSKDQLRQKLKEDQSGNKLSVANYLSAEFGLPKAFVEKVIPTSQEAFRTLRSVDRDLIAEHLSEHAYSVSGTGGFKAAMVTAGGVALEQIDLKTMSLKDHANIHIIGEALDINGDTGGYNLQFAYSSAMTAR